MDPADLARRAWPHARGALLALHVLAVVLMAVPSPDGGMKRSAWADPTVQAELDAWAERLGVEDRAAFEERLWDAASGYVQVRRQVLRPFQPYYDYCGTRQSWRMFVAPNLYPARLHLEVRRGGAWETVYVARSGEAAWLRRTLDHDRVRSLVFLYSWKHQAENRRRLAGWLAARAAEDFPDATALRMRYFKYRLPTPRQARRGEEPAGKFTSAVEIDLEGGDP